MRLRCGPLRQVESRGTSDSLASAPPGDYEHWSGHVIVCGLEGVGLRTVEQLRVAEVPVVVLDDDPSARMAALVESWGCPHMKSDGDPGTQLRAAGVAGARAVVCTQASDLRNVETALLVRDMREDISVVVHLDNPTVGRAVEAATGAGSALDVAGLFAPPRFPSPRPGRSGPCSATSPRSGSSPSRASSWSARAAITRCKPAIA